MTVFKVIEIMASSPKSWEDGTIGTSHPKSMKLAQKQAVAIAYSKAKKK